MRQYLEERTISAINPTIGSDIARHILTRQHLGKVVVICDKPISMMSVTRKYWLRLARGLQRERSSTLNADKILQLTHDITHMQRMQFANKSYSDSPGADVFFWRPEQLHMLPTDCYSLYIADDTKTQALATVIGQLPDLSLVIDYTKSTIAKTCALRPKMQLEQAVMDDWHVIEHFLHNKNINPNYLAEHSYQSELINAALDSLLNVSTQFTRLAQEFQQTLRLAQPLQITNSQRKLYDLVGVLNRQISALTPGIMSQQFIQTLGEDEPLLRDVGMAPFQPYSPYRKTSHRVPFVSSCEEAYLLGYADEQNWRTEPMEWLGGGSRVGTEPVEDLALAFTW